MLKRFKSNNINYSGKHRQPSLVYKEEKSAF
jgi:hypothetical protein